MEITLVYPHQLFAEHPSIQSGRPVALIEDPLFFGTDHEWPQLVHRQKLLLHRASMQAYAETLRSKGFDVVLQHHHLARDTATHLQLLLEQGYRIFHLANPVDDLLERRLHAALKPFGGSAVIAPTPMLLTPQAVIDEHFSSGKKPFMARFYEMQRRRLNLLLEPDGGPLGGRWSFDAENRKKLPKGIVVPPEPEDSLPATLQTQAEQIGAESLPGIGSCDGFAYPVTHAAAEAWLDQFLEQRLSQFGAYEDAISSQHRVMWHGVLTPMLNCGLLTPQQILDRTLARAESGDVPLNSLEGFVRQIVGWREFMAAMYRRHGVEMRNGNFWDFEDRPIPQAFYTASTGLPPIDDAIRHALETGYCHHIERLMLLGNLMLLCGFHPTRIYTWFMELFVDAYDWVMVPNVYGMSQFADGGIFTTKPYLSGSNYVRKMSDYRKGDWCDIWDGLFWSFIKQHESFFRGQYRLAMMARNLDRMAPDILLSHQRRAQQFLDVMG
ncbi:photolyase [Synechococcus sp. KORDI-100]|uniref:cryptochrome/photolyase family protein n=1 Tax=Synechococcus sp. KORDI-100 TaxID=1280380 RepID=UPI0004E09F24|nr:cryptochrome/photolyase family protein [Synechococcus sp. KORDI-100]AII43447.1 photolyase [Synechococcus sp. KORDI-100]